jgi:hypothetical protein
MNKSQILRTVSACVLILFTALPNVSTAVSVASFPMIARVGDTVSLTSSPPYAILSFDDGGTPGSVTMTMSLDSDLDPVSAFLKGLYFNFDPALDLGLLNFAYDQSSTTQAASNISVGANSHQVGAAGFFDVFIQADDLVPDKFTVGETLTYLITSPQAISANSFNFTNVGTVLYYAAAELGGTGDGSGTTIIAAPAVPIPAAVWLFGSGLLGLIGMARRKKAA